MHTIVTHSGSFHADDVFSVAAFQLLLGEENIEIVRTRDEALIAQGDYVVDVGGVYDHTARRYDHHQPGAPVRDNGIPYAGFGLMWRHYGEEICGSAEVAQKIEERLCQPVDAGDNGVTLYELNDLQVKPFELYNIVSTFTPPWNSDESKDDQFLKAVDWARFVLERIIVKEGAGERQLQLIEDVYKATEDKRVLVFDVPVSARFLPDYPEVEMIVSPDDDQQSQKKWTAVNVIVSPNSFEGRASFPESWAGLRGEELQKVSGIADAEFCHKACFIFVAGSRESAIKAAKLAE